MGQGVPAPLGQGAPAWPRSPAAPELVSPFQPQTSAFPTSPSLPGPFCRRMLHHQRYFGISHRLWQALQTPSTLDPLGCRGAEAASRGRDQPGAGWGSPAGGSGDGDRSSSIPATRNPGLLCSPVPMRRADRGGVVLTGKGKMSKQHSPGSFFFFFFKFPDKERTFFFFFLTPLSASAAHWLKGCSLSI